MSPLYNTLGPPFGQRPSTPHRKTGQPGLPLSPGAVITNAAAWYKADDGITSGGNNTAVTNWADKSGNGWDIAPGSSPLWFASVAALNNQPSVTFFSGSANYLFNNAFTGWNAKAGAALFFVMKPTGILADQIVVGDGHAAGVLFEIFGSAVYISPAAAFPASSVYGTRAYASTAAVMFSVLYDGSQATNALKLRGFVDGVEKVLTYVNPPVPAALNATNGIMLGNDLTAPASYDGELPEVIIYSRVIGTTEQTAIEAYLRAKYATP